MSWWKKTKAASSVDKKEPASERSLGKTNDFRHFIDYQYLLFERHLIANGWVHSPTSNDFELKVLDAAGRSLEVECHRYPRPDVAAIHGSFGADLWGFVLVAELQGRPLDGLSLEIHRQGEGTTVALRPEQTDDLRKPFRVLEMLGPKQPEEVRKRLVATAVGTPHLQRLIAHSIPHDQAAQLGMVHLDRAIRLSDGLFLDGWMNDYTNHLTACYLLVNGVVVDDIKPGFARYRRDDITAAIDYLPSSFNAGVYGYVPLRGEQVTSVACLCLFRDGSVHYGDIGLEQVGYDEIGVSQVILQHVDVRQPELPELFENHIDAPLQTLWQPLRTRTRPRSVTDFGKVEKPACSIIVPIYGRCDFVLHQLAQFTLDPELAEVEIIYVLDDPRLEAEFMALCADAHEIFRIPFRVVINRVNLGFAGANNVGVAQARSERLLLMNSDVLPPEPGWLGRLLAAYDRLDNPGAVGVKLLFDDDTVQHAGMAFVRHPAFPGIWLNDHPHKGMPEWTLERHEPVVEMPCVTAACMMLSKTAYEAVGGFDTSYILGDFEDSDLCLKLLEKGYRNYLVTDVWLYHLERQSQSHLETGDWKFKLTLYNGWQHTRRWSRTIETLVEEAST